MHQEADKELQEVEKNLDRLTLDIPDIYVDDLPMRYKRHTTSVSR